MKLTEIAGEPLSPEQAAYLDGWFAGLKNRGFAFDQVVTNPVTASNPSARRPVPVEVEELIP